MQEFDHPTGPCMVCCRDLAGHSTSFGYCPFIKIMNVSCFYSMQLRSVIFNFFTRLLIVDRESPLWRMYIGIMVQSAM